MNFMKQREVFAADFSAHLRGKAAVAGRKVDQPIGQIIVLDFFLGVKIPFEGTEARAEVEKQEIWGQRFEFLHHVITNDNSRRTPQRIFRSKATGPFSPFLV